MFIGTKKTMCIPPKNSSRTFSTNIGSDGRPSVNTVMLASTLSYMTNDRHSCGSFAILKTGGIVSRGAKDKLTSNFVGAICQNRSSNRYSNHESLSCGTYSWSVEISKLWKL